MQGLMSMPFASKDQSSWLVVAVAKGFFLWLHLVSQEWPRHMNWMFDFAMGPWDYIFPISNHAVDF